MLARVTRAFGGGDLALVLVRGEDPAAVEKAAQDAARELAKTDAVLAVHLDVPALPATLDPTEAWRYAGPAARDSPCRGADAGRHGGAASRAEAPPARAGRGRSRRLGDPRSTAPVDDPVRRSDRGRRWRARCGGRLVRVRGRSFAPRRDRAARLRVQRRCGAALHRNRERRARARERARRHACADRRPRHRDGDGADDPLRSREERSAVGRARVARVRARVPAKARAHRRASPAGRRHALDDRPRGRDLSAAVGGRDGVRGGRHRRRRRYRRARIRPLASRRARWRARSGARRKARDVAADVGRSARRRWRVRMPPTLRHRRHAPARRALRRGRGAHGHCDPARRAGARRAPREDAS